MPARATARRAWSTRSCASASMRVLYFGTYDRAYPRNAQVISALRGAGVDVREEHRPVWERRHNWSLGAAPAPAARRGRAQPRQQRREASTRSSSAIRAISTCRPQSAPRADGLSCSTRSCRSSTRSSATAAASAAACRRRHRAHRRPQGVSEGRLVVADTQAHARFFREEFRLADDRRRGLPGRRRGIQAWITFLQTSTSG